MFKTRFRLRRRRSALCGALSSARWVRRREQRMERARVAAHLRNAPKLGIAFDYFDAMFFFSDYIGSFLLFLYACCGPEGPADRRLSYLLALLMCVLYAIREALEFFKHLDEDNEAHECVYYYPKRYLLSLSAMFFLSLCTALYILNFKDSPYEATSYYVVALALIALYGPGVVLRMHFFVSSLEGPAQGLVSSYHTLVHRMGNIAAHCKMGNIAGEPSLLLSFLNKRRGRNPRHDSPFSHVTQTKQNPLLFLSLWNNVIEPEIQGLIGERGVECDDLETARDRIYAAYLELNSYCKLAYYQNSAALIDRHQIAACLTYAVLVAEPLVVDSTIATERSYYANERLAFTLGCSTMVSFLVQYYFDRMVGITNRVECEGLRAARNKLLREGIAVPITVPNEDSYPMTLYRCLRFTAAEGSFNPLSLASLYYLLENATVEERLYEEMRDYYSAP